MLIVSFSSVGKVLKALTGAELGWLNNSEKIHEKLCV